MLHRKNFPIFAIEINKLLYIIFSSYNYINYFLIFQCNYRYQYLHKLQIYKLYIVIIYLHNIILI